MHVVRGCTTYAGTKERYTPGRLGLQGDRGVRGEGGKSVVVAERLHWGRRDRGEDKVLQHFVRVGGWAGGYLEVKTKSSKDLCVRSSKSRHLPRILPCGCEEKRAEMENAAACSAIKHCFFSIRARLLF